LEQICNNLKCFKYILKNYISVEEEEEEEKSVRYRCTVRWQSLAIPIAAWKF
jgi:hypothetical protein